MLSSVTNNERAVLVNIEIMRAFVRLRRMLASNADALRLDVEGLRGDASPGKLAACDGDLGYAPRAGRICSASPDEVLRRSWHWGIRILSVGGRRVIPEMSAAFARSRER